MCIRVPRAGVGVMRKLVRKLVKFIKMHFTGTRALNACLVSF